MKSLLLATISTFFLFCCKSETKINPSTVTSFEYGVYYGFIGQVIKLTVFPQKEILQPDYRSSKTCKSTISDTEWIGLADLFDENAFKKVKVGEASTCPDAGSSWIIARSSAGEIQAVWGPCTGGDPTGIQPLIDALYKRMKAQQAICK